MAIYEGDHSITFGDGTLRNQRFVGKNTWTDWHLIPATRPTPAMPGFATKYVGIPGRDGSIDLSEFLVKRPIYGDRSGSFQFFIDHEHYSNGETWVKLYHDIATYLHGQRMRMCLDDDPTWYYEGRFSLNELSPDAAFSSLTINYQVGPFKYRIYASGNEDIIWDTFNFESDYDYSIFHNRTIAAGTSESFTIVSGHVPFSIYAKCYSGTGAARLNGGTEVSLTSAFQSLGITHNGNNTLTIRSLNNTPVVIDVTFQEGSL